MRKANICTGCGGRLQEPDRLCPRCLLGEGLRDDKAPGPRAFGAEVQGKRRAVTAGRFWPNARPAVWIQTLAGLTVLVLAIILWFGAVRTDNREGQFRALSLPDYRRLTTDGKTLRATAASGARLLVRLVQQDSTTTLLAQAGDRVTTVGTDPVDPLGLLKISGDGQWLFHSGSWEGRRISWIIPVRKAPRAGWSAYDLDIDLAGWSPDRSLLVMVRRRSDETAVLGWLDPRQPSLNWVEAGLLEPSGQIRALAWVPGGRDLLVSLRSGTLESGLWILRTEGSAERLREFPFSIEAMALDWPNGKLYLVSAGGSSPGEAGGRFTVWRLKIDEGWRAGTPVPVIRGLRSLQIPELGSNPIRVIYIRPPGESGSGSGDAWLVENLEPDLQRGTGSQ